MSTIISKTHVRRYALSMIEAKRPGLKGKITRVSADFFTKVDAAAKAFITNYVEAMPSTGKTIK